MAISESPSACHLVFELNKLNYKCALVHIFREFLRKLLVGKAVTGLVLRVDPNTQREYGSVYLGPDTETAENVSVSLVKEGLAKVRQMSQVSSKAIKY